MNLTREDWVEIYYALDARITAIEDGMYGAESEHLRDIIDKIGPDGENMYKEGL